MSYALSQILPTLRRKLRMPSQNAAVLAAGERLGAIGGLGQPMVEEGREPAQRPVVVKGAALEMGLAPLAARLAQAVGAARRPAMDHGERQFDVELDAIDGLAVAESLVGEGFAGGKQSGAGREVEALLVEMMDLLGPV